MMICKNSKKGLTLVELLVASVVGVIVIAAACSALYFGMNNYKSGAADLTNHQNASLLEDYLQHDLASATKVEVAATALTKSKSVSMYFDSSKTLFIVETDGVGGSTTTKINGIDSIALKTVDVDNGIGSKKITYIIKSTVQNQSRTLTVDGGIVMNNCKYIITKTIANTDTTTYLNIQKPL